MILLALSIVSIVAAALNENSWEYKHMKNEHHLTMYDVSSHSIKHTDVRTMRFSGYTTSIEQATGLQTT